MTAARTERLSLVRRALGAALTVTAAAMASCHGSGEPTSLMLTDAELHSAPTINIGDAAPPVVASEWVRGDPIQAPGGGRVLVIDFWASWCGPCVAVMSRLSALQQKHAAQGVVAIAMTALDNANGRDDVLGVVREVDPTCRVAIDGGPHGDATLRAYMHAARETSIPRTFIVDRQGRIAWIGHPQDADPVVQAVAAGTWDIAGAAAKRRRDADDRLASRTLVDQWVKARNNNDVEGQLSALRALAAMDPDSVTNSPAFAIDWSLIDVLAAAGRSQEALDATDAAMRKEPFRTEPWALAEFARAIKPVSAPRSQELAQTAEALAEAHRTAPPSQDSWDRFLQEAQRSWDCQAYAVLAGYWDSCGDPARAAGLMEHALELADTRFTQYRETLQRSLDDYRRRAGTRG